MSTPHISLVAENVFRLFGLGINNSLITAWLVIAVLVGLSVLSTRHLAFIPNRIQSAAELIVETLLNLFSGLIGENLAVKFLPLLGTFFLFIILSNWSGLIPGAGTIGLTTHEGFVPFFRAPTADLNTTVALATFAVVTVQYTGIAGLGINYLKKFFNFSNPMNFFVGILEIISEFSRLISFTFRLFGNIFAGEVLLTVVAFLAPLIIPLPFLGLEIFVGFIQALVFTMLTATFLKLAVVREGH